MNKEKQDVFYEHKEHKIENTNLYYKEIFDIPSFIQERKYIKVNDKINKIAHHIHLYKKDKLVGVLLFHNENKTYKVDALYLKDKKYFKPFILDIYKEIYAKVNPITFLVISKGFINELESLLFVQFDNKYYSININPIKLENVLKKKI